MNKKLTDKGWKSMRQLLDREMPVKKRRSFAFWWLAALLLPLSLYGSWWYWSSGEAPQSKPVAPAQARIAGVPPESFQANRNMTETQIPEPAANLTPYLRAESPTLRQHTVQMPSPESGVEKVENSPAPSSPSIAPETAFAPALETTPILSTLSIPTGIRPVDIAAKTIDHQPQTRAFTGKHLTRPIHRKTIEFASTSLAGTNQCKRINGFATGLTFDWNFSKRWGLRSGLFYQIYTPEETSKPVAAVESETYSSKVGEKVVVLDAITGAELNSLSGAGFSSDSIADDVLIPVNRLQKLEIPLNISYQLSRSWKCFGGISIARNLSAKADRLSYSGDYILRVTDRNAADGVSELSSGKLKSWTGDAMLGAGWRVGKVFELGLTAKMPFSRLPNFSKNKVLEDNLFNPVTVASNSTQNKRKPLFALYASLYF